MAPICFLVSPLILSFFYRTLVLRLNILLIVSDLTFILCIALGIVLVDQCQLIVTHLAIDKRCQGMELAVFMRVLCQLNRSEVFDSYIRACHHVVDQRLGQPLLEHPLPFFAG